MTKSTATCTGKSLYSCINSKFTISSLSFCLRMEEKTEAPVCFDAESNLFAPEEDSHSTSNGCSQEVLTFTMNAKVRLYF